jgi:protein-S-isoprenylcysteine O-methyltransferase Ste14
MKLKIWLSIGIEAVIFAALLFGSAGTLRWRAAWAFLVLFFGAAVQLTRLLARSDPALLAERMKLPIQSGQPLWDRFLLGGIAILFIGWLPLMGLDAVRFRWSAVPVWFQVVGAAGVAAGMWICYLAFRANTFLAPVVRIQEERGQTVISTGPYAVVRHPLYAGAMLLLSSSALLLGSWYGFAASFVLGGLVVVRAVLEERELRRGLAGYREYAARVRHRFIPGIW